MAIYEISHIYEKKYFRKDRKVIIVGNNRFDDVICESELDDNIAYKNKNYCELTAIYALNKNIKDDFYGIEHYRRFFCNGFGKQITEKEVKKIIGKGNIILPIPMEMNPNNFLNYSMHHHIKDLEIVRDIIISEYREYFDSFEAVMCSSKLSCFNMIICDAFTFDCYCKWLFEILGKLEKKVDINEYSPYQARLYGFISERLLNVWVHHNIPNEKIIYRGVCQVDNKSNSLLKIIVQTIAANFMKR